MAGFTTHRKRRKIWQRAAVERVIRDLRIDRLWVARDVARFVAPYFGVTAEDIFGSSRWFVDADARHLTIALALRLTRASKYQIGRSLFGAYDSHTFGAAQLKFDKIIDEALFDCEKSLRRRRNQIKKARNTVEGNTIATEDDFDPLLQELRVHHERLDQYNELLGDGGEASRSARPKHEPGRNSAVGVETTRLTYHDEAA